MEMSKNGFLLIPVISTGKTDVSVDVSYHGEQEYVCIMADQALIIIMRSLYLHLFIAGAGIAHWTAGQQVE